MKRYLILLVTISMAVSASATTYYSVSDGDWESDIWSSVNSTTLPGIFLPTLVDGDIIIVDNQVTISGYLGHNSQSKNYHKDRFFSEYNTSPAKLIFTNGGKLNLRTQVLPLF